MKLLGGNNLIMFLVTRERWGDNVDGTEKMIEDGSEYGEDYSVAALPGDASFHKSSLNVVDSLDHEDVYVGLGDKPLEMVKKTSQDLLREAKANGP